jgi:hypothetical protein
MLIDRAKARRDLDRIVNIETTMSSGEAALFIGRGAPVIRPADRWAQANCQALRAKPKSLGADPVGLVRTGQAICEWQYQAANLVQALSPNLKK